MATDSAPVAVANLPLPQLVHEPANAPEYLPPKHVMQTVVAAREYLPAVHPRHVAVEEAPVEAE
jgi:hypothetical protein